VLADAGRGVITDNGVVLVVVERRDDLYRTHIGSLVEQQQIHITPIIL